MKTEGLSAANLPGVLREIADIAGEEAALAVAAARGGTQIYLPTVPPIDHWLCRLIGVKQARAVAEHLTCGIYGCRIELPLGPAGHAAKARATVDAMLMEGRSERDIAIATGYSVRGIRMRRKRLGRPPDQDRQLSMF